MSDVRDRIARALYEATYPHGIPPTPWSNISQDWETQYKRKTRAVLSAVLGPRDADAPGAGSTDHDRDAVRGAGRVVRCDMCGGSDGCV